MPRTGLTSSEEGDPVDQDALVALRDALEQGLVEELRLRGREPDRDRLKVSVENGEVVVKLRGPDGSWGRQAVSPEHLEHGVLRPIVLDILSDVAMPNRGATRGQSID